MLIKARDEYCVGARNMSCGQNQRILIKTVHKISFWLLRLKTHIVIPDEASDGLHPVAVKDQQKRSHEKWE